jgi:glycosyltransferase involved in cell wall biosynthesis
MNSNRNDLLLVSVCITTYNHKNYIAECLDSVLMQQTNFRFEIILGEDESLDGTRELCIEYANKHPDKIKLFLRSRKDVIYINGNPTGRYNLTECLKSAKSKYIALCEGDDYWCDENKLQKQIDFLESNTDYAICYHRVSELKNEKLLPDEMNSAETEMTYTLEDLARKNFIHTPSVIFRNGLIEKFPGWYNNSPAADYVLHMLNAKYGLIKYFPEPMAVYRRHGNSIWSAMPELRRIENWLLVLSYLVPEFAGNEKVKIILQEQAIYGFRFYSKIFHAENKKSALGFEALDNITKLLIQKMPVFALWWFDNIYKNQVYFTRSFPWGLKKSSRHFIAELKKHLL